ncbi:MAG: hypothetical protein IJB66_01975, partial [Oscillospiraceae bacterium]|nr:hypothetical protein [Oscillospiraceae bacterium]
VPKIVNFAATSGSKLQGLESVSLAGTAVSLRRQRNGGTYQTKMADFAEPSYISRKSIQNPPVTFGASPL